MRARILLLIIAAGIWANFALAVWAYRAFKDEFGYVGVQLDSIDRSISSGTR
jgi:hypothetical protein